MDLGDRDALRFHRYKVMVVLSGSETSGEARKQQLIPLLFVGSVKLLL